jgi:hypothetical protein
MFLEALASDSWLPKEMNPICHLSSLRGSVLVMHELLRVLLSIPHARRTRAGGSPMPLTLEAERREPSGRSTKFAVKCRAARAAPLPLTKLHSPK